MLQVELLDLLLLLQQLVCQALLQLHHRLAHLHQLVMVLPLHFLLDTFEHLEELLLLRELVTLAALAEGAQQSRQLAVLLLQRLDLSSEV